MVLKIFIEDKPWNIDAFFVSFGVSSRHRRCIVFSFRCKIKTLFDTTRLLILVFRSNLEILFVRNRVEREILPPWKFTLQEDRLKVSICCQSLKKNIFRINSL